MIAEREVFVDHSTLHRWSIKMSPELAAIQADSGLPIVMRQSNYRNNIVEPDQRAIKRVTRPMLGFKTLRSARTLVAGIEVMHMIRNGQLGALKD